MNVEQYANTSTAAIPIALNEMNEKGILNRGDNILTVGFQLLDENLIHRSVQTSESTPVSAYILPLYTAHWDRNAFLSIYGMAFQRTNRRNRLMGEITFPTI